MIEVPSELANVSDGRLTPLSPCAYEAFGLARLGKVLPVGRALIMFSGFVLPHPLWLPTSFLVFVCAEESL